MIEQNYEIKAMETASAQAIHVKDHYLHRRASCSYAFGLYERSTGKVMGVILYGTPASPNVARGVCGKEEMLNVVELTRLWIDNSVGKNAESYLISHTLPLVPKDIVISYAEPGVGHRGIVYQATNFIYTGLTAKRTNWQFEGREGKHNRGATSKYTSAQLKEIYGDKFTLVARPLKHRYVYINAKNKGRKKELLKKLKYAIVPYPKKVEIFMSDPTTKEKYTTELESFRQFLGQVYFDLEDKKAVDPTVFVQKCKEHFEVLNGFLK